MAKIKLHSNCSLPTSEASLSTEKLRDLKELLPHAQPSRSKKILKILTSAKNKHRDLISGPSKPSAIQKPVKNHFKYPNDWIAFGNEVMRKAWRDDKKFKNLQKKVVDKKNVRGELNADMLERLYVTEPPSTGEQWVVDIDPNFFKLVEGRLFSKKGISVRKYIETSREILKTKILIGYCEDKKMLMESSIQIESEYLEFVQKKLRNYIDIFEDFLFIDHSSAKDTLARYNLVVKQMFETNEQSKKLQNQKRDITMRLLCSLMYFDQLKRLKKFLFQLSPHYWKVQHNDYAEENASSDDFFETSTNNENDVELTEEIMLKQVKKNCAEVDSGCLYFTEPKQIMDVFEYIQLQNLKYLLHNEELAIPLDYTRKVTEFATWKFDKMIENLESSAKRLEVEILYEESRAIELERLSLSLINNDFKKLVASDEILNLLSTVEDLYETVIGENYANIGMRDMMKGIQNKYMEIQMCRDTMPGDIIQRLEERATAEEAATMRLAEDAGQKYTQFMSLTKQINLACLPPYEKPRYKPLMPRSLPPQEYKPPPPPERILTEKELDYIYHFNDFNIDVSVDPKNIYCTMERDLSNTLSSMVYSKKC